MATMVVLAGYANSLVHFRLELLRSFVAAGYKVVALAPEIEPETVETLNKAGVEFRPYYLDRNGTNLFKDLLTILGLVRIYRELRPEIVFAYTVKPVIYGSLAARLGGVPRVFSMITGLGYAFLNRRNVILAGLVKSLYRIALRGNRCIFFQNPDDLSLFRSLGIVTERQKVALVGGSGVDLEHFSCAPVRQAGCFLMIARFMRGKGVREYVEAARVLKRSYPDAAFRLAGWRDEGPDSVSKQDIDEWRREGAVEFLGKLKDVRPALVDCAVYVLPSYREGTPRSVLEALATGRAVITTDAPGCRETVIDGENGFMVPVGSAEQLAAAMKRFILEPDLAIRMAPLSRKLAEDRFDVRKVNAAMLEHMELP